VTGLFVLAAQRTAGQTALGIFLLIIFLSWVLLFVVLLAYVAVAITSRGRVQRAREAARQAAARRSATRRATTPPARVSAIPTQLAALRRADPHFDEQLLLDAALTATMLVFAATSTGDAAPISRLVTESFWQTPFGRLTGMTARDRRREDGQSALDQARGRKVSRWNIPLDYQPSVPELVSVEIAAEHRVTVRVSFNQLQAVVRPGAANLAAGAAATNFVAAMASIGKAAAADKNKEAQDVSWLAAGGRYDLLFIRPADARTDSTAALADRTCTTCGATYRSELAVACAHCGAERPLPWGRWRLADAAPV